MEAARPTHTRNRSKSTFSFRSSKSDKSDPTRPRPDVADLHETENEKRRSKWTGKTTRDPNKAIREAQPADRQDETNTLPSIRAMEHKDWRGEVIADADRSNPTRPRLERPLDTIRSFEAAIDGEWKRKSVIQRSESADFTQYSSRRNSYVAGGYETPYGNRHSTPVGGYGPPRNPHRYNDHYAQRPGNPRYQSSPMVAPPPAPQNGWASHPAHGYSQSYDTVDTGGTSGSEPWANSTDPSSENSSIERMYGINNGNNMNGANGMNSMNNYSNGHKPDYADPYNNLYRRESPRHDPIQEEHGFDGNGYTQGQWNPTPSQPPPRHSGQYGPPRPMHQAPPGAPMGHSMGPPPPPSHQPQRNLIPLTGAAAAGPAPQQYGPTPTQRPSVLRKESNSGDGKRKSWLRRRFSKN